MINLAERNGELQAATGLMVAAAITLSTAGVRIAELQTDHDDQQALLAAVRAAEAALLGAINRAQGALIP